MLGCLVQALAQPAAEYNFTVRHFGVEEGLVNRRVDQVVQDQQGFLWLATPGGVQRFDGNSFQSYTTADGLTTNAISMIWPDADGLLWLISKSAYSEGHISAIDILDPRNGKVTPYAKHFGEKVPAPLDELTDKAITLNDGTLLLAAAGRLVLYHSAAKGSTEIITTKNGALRPLVMTEGDVLWCMRTEPLQEFQELVKVDPAGNVTPVGESPFRFINNGMVEGCDLRMGQRSFYFLAEEETVGVFEFRIAPAGKLERLSGPLLSVDKFLRGDGFLLDLGEGLVLIEAAVYRLGATGSPRNGEVVHDLGLEHKLAEVGILYAMQDHGGNIWLCNEFGLWQLNMRRSKFHGWLQHTDPLMGIGFSFRGMHVIGDTLYASSESNGSWAVDTRSGNSRRMDKGKWELRYAMEPDGKGGFWTNRTDTLIHWNNGRWVGRELLTERLVFSILPMGDERLLLGTNRGLAWADTGLTRYVPFSDAEQGTISATTVSILHRDRAGKVWAGTTGGLCELNSSGAVSAIWSHNDAERHLPGEDFHHIYEDPHGIFWLSTGTSGLIRWDRSTGDVRSITMRDGLPSNGIYAAYPDDKGRLWLPTDHGIVRYDTLSGQISTYTVADGITHSEFNTLSHTQGPDGRLYFGGLNGITVFHPDEVDDLQRQSPLVISRIEQHDGSSGQMIDRTAEVARSKTIEINPSDRFVRLNMALLSFEKPSDVLFGWRIEDIDTDWNNQRDPVLRLVSLPYGTHRLRIRAKGGSGEWNQQELELSINVIKPWYLRWWAIVLFILALIGAMYLLFRIRLARVRAMMAMRDRIALDLHDEVGSTLSSVALFSTAISNTKKDRSPEETDMLKRISENSAQAMESMNDIVWSVNTRYDKLADVEDRMNAYAGPLADAQQWQLDIVVEESIRHMRLTMNERKNLYLIFKEAVNNAAKYAQCDHVAVKLIKVGQGVELKVEDDGIGMPHQQNGTENLGGNGLRSMQLRAEAINGDLRIAKGDTAGTVITLRFQPHPE